ncbi:hypothetical protein [Oceaniserpentilla sp. 4NH20-0058]|uniref:hypothetical protein n=1 Tax=Oceaniserpentilla sp. 4NH20-0058 TaxID=3127660 RepID=UPI0033427292
MKYFTLLLLAFSQLSLALSLDKEQTKYVDDCEVLLEQIKHSECGKTTLAFLKNAYLKIGLDISQRSMSFKNTSTSETAYEMKGEFSLSPLLTASLGDNYFKNSNFGYQLGASYFSDTAFNQYIERGSQSKEIDMQTYSKMTVIAFTPTLFYSFGDHLSQRDNFFTLGIGLTAGYSKVKGNAYVTNDTTNSVCYDAGTQFVLNNVSPAGLLNCEFRTYESDGLSYGARIYLAYEYHKWITEISGSNYNQDLDSAYTFSTFDFSFSVSRKFGF